MDPDKLAQLSRRYALYSHSLPGLSLAFGGVVMLLMLLAPPLLQNYVQACWENYRGLLALSVSLLLTAWILAKEWVRSRIYHSLGLSEVRASMAEAVFTRCLAVAVGTLALAYLVRLLAIGPHPEPVPTPIQHYVGMTACFALPWATIRFIRGWQEGLLWFFLCYWALALIWTFPLAGFLYGGHGILSVTLFISLPLAYIGGLAVGLVQHFNFLRLMREIRTQEPRDE